MRSLSLLALLAAPLFSQSARLNVDATDVSRRLLHIRLTLPAKPGPMTLLYPEWIPGEHGPTGPIANLVGLKIKAGSQAIPWRRDSVNMYAFHIEVPAGAASLDVAFDFIPAPESEGFSSGGSSTSELAVLNWNQLLLYPQGSQPDDLQYQATLRVPNGWRYGTALPIQRETGNEVQFQPAPLTTLIDSPVSTGAHYRTIDLGADGNIHHYLHVAADSDKALDAPADLITQYKSLVTQAGALFGARHFRNYHFLYTLSDHVAHFGLEHHESSDNRLGERAMVDPEPRKLAASLLPHEFVHSWNGKYRRPGGLAPGNRDGGFETPMKGDLLWVYEGLTNYLGEVLAARSGLWSPEDYRDNLALIAARLDHQFGRTWRPLEDTAVFAQVLYESGGDYNDYRRSVDFYPEGTLLWLETDVMIRQLSKGTKSLDDFCKTFHGGSSGAIAFKTYEFGDVVAALNSVQSYDWAAFLNQRLKSTDARAPLGGIERGGWKLSYDANRSSYQKAAEGEARAGDFSYSIGLRVRDDGSIADVSIGGPSQTAGVSPATKLIAVNKRQFSLTVLRDAIAAGKPIELLTKNGEYYETHRINYTGGEKYPHLVRAGGDDLLTAIIQPAAKP